jgi:hypothetical protein
VVVVQACAITANIVEQKLFASVIYATDDLDGYGCTFITHSVVEEAGRVFDIIPFGPDIHCPDYLGSPKEFDAMKTNRASVPYPFVTALGYVSPDGEPEWCAASVTNSGEFRVLWRMILRNPMRAFWL